MASTILNANSANSSGSSGQVFVYSSTSTNYSGTVTIPASYSVTGSNGYTWSNITTSNASSSLEVTGDADIKGTLKVGGKDIAKSLEAIERRLSILVPDPDKLEHFEALKKAYEHYKVLEALCEIPKKEKE